MTSKEALKELIENAQDLCEWELVRLNIIKQDLDRLEKVIGLLWYKNVNIAYIKIFKYFEKYSEYYMGYSSKDKLTKEEFDLLKDVLENGL